MNISNRSKINSLLSDWPHGAVYTTSWLKKHGYSNSLVDLYRKNGWLKRLERGAVIKSGDKATWQGGIYALQKQLGLTIYPSATTALLVQGASHYVALGKERIFLSSEQQAKLPAWFKNYEWDVDVDFRSSSLLSAKPGLGLHYYDCGNFSIKISSLERAILELLALVPQVHNFEYAEQHLETLMSLRPKMLQKLLEACSFVKVKRLFLYLAERLEMPWFKELKLNRIDLGHGKRVLLKSGRFDSKYKITVPKEWA